MANQTLNLTDELYRYLLANSLRESDVQRELRAKTAALPMARMQIAPEQGQFMALLAQLMGVRRAIEVGVFTGYSALSVAQVLPDDGELLACDISTEYTDIAQPFWRRAGVEHKISLQIGPAEDSLQRRLERGEAGQFDFAFIDADKVNYQNYYELCLQLLRAGGLIAVDNVLWGGSVIDDRDQSPDTVAIRQFNQSLTADPRVDISLLPLADGLTLIRKK